MTHSTVRKTWQNRRYYSIITAIDPKQPLLFEPRFDISAMVVQYCSFRGPCKLRLTTSGNLGLLDGNHSQEKERQLQFSSMSMSMTL